MRFKEKFSNHSVPFGISLIIAGFVSGYAVYPQINNDFSRNEKTRVKVNSNFDCKELKSFLGLKQTEIVQKEEEVARASPMIVGSETDQKSLYVRRLKELETLREQINTANINYIQCISGK